MTGSFDSVVIGARFGLVNPPTLLARARSASPIAFTRLQSSLERHARAQDVEPEAAFSFHVALQPITLDLWNDRRHALSTRVASGAAFLFDLSRNSVSQIHSTFDILRFYISQAALNELALEHGHGTVSLARPLMHRATAACSSIKSAWRFTPTSAGATAQCIAARRARPRRVSHRGSYGVPWTT